MDDGADVWMPIGDDVAGLVPVSQTDDPEVAVVEVGLHAVARDHHVRREATKLCGRCHDPDRENQRQERA